MMKMFYRLFEEAGIWPGGSVTAGSTCIPNFSAWVWVLLTIPFHLPPDAGPEKKQIMFLLPEFLLSGPQHFFFVQIKLAFNAYLHDLKKNFSVYRGEIKWNEEEKRGVRKAGVTEREQLAGLLDPFRLWICSGGPGAHQFKACFQ